MKLFCNIFLNSMRCSNLVSYFPRYFYSFFIKVMIFSSRQVSSGIAWMASFLVRICHVVFLCSGKKMIRTNAFWIVTFMKNVQVLINVTVSQLPRKSMGKTCFATFVTSNLENSISRLIGACSPFPTGRSLFNFVPKTLHL